MRKLLAGIVFAMTVPTVAAADPGSYDKEFYRGLERNYQVQRDGSLERMIEEGRANKQAFENLKQQQLDQQTTATGSTRRHP